MHNMVEKGKQAAPITPPACLPNLLFLTREPYTPHWWEKSPVYKFHAVEFTSQWDYEHYVHVECSDAVLEQYRFIGEFDKNDDFKLERIIRADWLAVHHEEAANYANRAYRAFRTGACVAVEKVPAVMEIPPWPADVYKETENHPEHQRDWTPVAPGSLRPKLLPIYNICSGNSLPEGFHQFTLHTKNDFHEYLYIDVPNAELTEWALIGSLEKDWERGGVSLIDVQHIQKVPLDWGEPIAHTLYREPDTGMLGTRKVQDNPDALIRGQLVKCLVDIQSDWLDKVELHAGDTLIIDGPSAEPDHYRVWQKVPPNEWKNERKMIFTRVPRDAMELLDGFANVEDS